MILNRIDQCVRFIPEKLGIDIEYGYSQDLRKQHKYCKQRNNFELLTGQVYKQWIRSIGYYIL